MNKKNHFKRINRTKFIGGNPANRVASNFDRRYFKIIRILSAFKAWGIRAEPDEPPLLIRYRLRPRVEYFFFFFFFFVRQSSGQAVKIPSKCLAADKTNLYVDRAQLNEVALGLFREAQENLIRDNKVRRQLNDSMDEIGK